VAVWVTVAFDLGKKARDFHCMIVQRALFYAQYIVTPGYTNVGMICCFDADDDDDDDDEKKR